MDPKAGVEPQVGSKAKVDSQVGVKSPARLDKCAHIEKAVCLLFPNNMIVNCKCGGRQSGYNVETTFCHQIVTEETP